MRILEKREEPSAPYVRYLAKEVKEIGILIDKRNREKPETVRTPENTADVAERVREAPSTSIHRRSQRLNISETSLRRILYMVWRRHKMSNWPSNALSFR